MNKLYISKIRQDRNMTQLEVSEKLGITKQSYSNIETGKRNPSLNIIIKMQTLFGEDIQKLLSPIE